MRLTEAKKIGKKFGPIDVQHLYKFMTIKAVNKEAAECETHSTGKLSPINREQKMAQPILLSMQCSISLGLIQYRCQS